MTNLRNVKGDNTKQFWLLRRYLRESDVPPALSLRIQRYCDFAWQSQQIKLQEKNVQVLALLSPALKADLNAAIYEPFLSTHPLFVLFSKIASDVNRRISNTAISRSIFMRGGSVFTTGEEVQHCYFIGSGEARYFMEVDGGNLQSIEVLLASWVAESALWVSWKTLGTLVTKKDSDILQINADKFAGAVCHETSIQQETQAYARGFLNGLNRTPKGKLTDVYKSSLIEGLWFRLLSEFNYQRQGGRDTVRTRRSLLSHDSSKPSSPGGLNAVIPE
jgi:hypothetical protein